MDKQRTFDGQLLPPSTLPTDQIECSDGSVHPHSEVHYDCRNQPHSSADECHESNVTIVEEILDGHDEWVSQYCNENSDYADCYAHIVDELSYEWPTYVDEWVYNNTPNNGIGIMNCPCNARIVELICDELQGSFDCVAEHCCNEYTAYSGDGCCLWGTDIGEYENQIEIASHAELNELHEQGILDDVLDDVNCNSYVSRHRRREKNEKTGRYEEAGRETYGPDDKYTCLITYHYPGGRWDFVVPAERMRELLTSAIVAYCEETDANN